MISAEEQLTQQFYAWEQRGRGWQLHSHPVTPEPPFRPFYGHFLPRQPSFDDGRKPTLLSSFFERLNGGTTKPPPQSTPPEVEPEPEPEPFSRDSLIELQTLLPADFSTSREAFEQLLSNLDYCREPLSFELLGLPDQIIAQFAVHPRDAPNVLRQLTASFPEAVFTRHERVLEQAWNEIEYAETAIVEFGLVREFMLPLATVRNFNPDPLIGLVGALSELQAGELGLFQVLFQPVLCPWAQSILRSVSNDEGKAFFMDSPELFSGARNKIERPLHAVVVRIATRSGEWDRTWDIARDLAAALRVFAHPNGNELIPLPNNGYVFAEHEEDVLHRQTRRSGMLLNRDELISFVHLPSASVRSPKLKREVRKSKAAPKLASSGALLGYNTHAGQTQPVYLSPDQRVRHLHLIGASGTGKSTLLFNLIRQDIENGEGVAVLDPHGDLVERILGVIPPDRIDDVILVDPSDEQFSVGFNFLSAHSDLEKNLLASDLVSVFQRLSTSWGDQMGSVLQNAILAFLESSQGGTLADLRRFLIEPKFREQFLKTVRDPDIVYYWRKGFAQLSGNKSIGPVLTRLETFLSPKPIRYMVAQAGNRLDFADILDTGKIFLAKLPQGQMGKENSFLLGSLFVAKFQQLVMGRQAQRVESRRPFYLYIDEFQNFITPSMAEILSGARKYRLGLILAHQELRQLERDREVASAVLSNPFTRVVFRVGDTDARTLENGFEYFEARDMQNLETGQAICRIEKASSDFNLSVPAPEDADPADADETRQSVITASRKRYATPRAEVEAMLLAKLEAEDVEPPKANPASPPPERVQVVPKDSEPKAAEVPKATISEPDKLAPVEPPVAKPADPAPAPTVTETPQPIRPIPEERGIGGHQHNLIRERIETVARTLGYYPAREKLTPEGGKIDVALEKSNQTIGCEISFSTTIDHEVGNVAKCIKAGCQHVAVITTNETRLGKIQQAVSVCLTADQLSRVGFYLPDQFIAYLQSLKSEDRSVSDPKEVKLGKYKVKSSASKLTPAEQQERESAAIKLMAESMRRKK